MLQHVNSVLVGKFPASFTTAEALNVGEIALFDQDGKIITSAAEVSKAKKVRFGLVESKMSVSKPDGTVVEDNNIRYSQFIDRNRVTSPNVEVKPFAASAEETYTIDLSAVTATEEDKRFAVKFIYRDLSEYKFQVTKTYDFYAVKGSTGAQIAEGLGKAINKDKERRIVASVAGSVITVTALPKTDNEGLEAINNYSQVSMEVYAFESNSKGLVNSQTPIVGAVMTKTVVATPGKGNAKIVRDREKEALGYLGITNRTQFPVIKPSLNTDLSKEYETLVIEWDNLYRSPDNQYVKSTPLAVEIYASGASATAHQALFNAILGEEAAAEAGE